MRTPSPLLVAVLASALVTAIGCAGPGAGPSDATRMRPPVSAPPVVPTVPEWALAGSSRDGEHELGIGSGRSLEEATRLALRDVAARLSISVRSRLTDTVLEADGTSVERLEQVIETRVSGARFAGWERTRSEAHDGIYWTEVRIDRGRLARDSSAELARIADEVDLRLETAAGSALRRLIALETTARDRERAADLVLLLGGLDAGFDRARWDARRSRWRAIDEAARRALVFEVRSDPASREIAGWIESRLVAERLQTRGGACDAPDAVCIDVRSELTEAELAHRHIAKIRSTVAVLEPGGALVHANDVEGRGASKADRERARRRALDDLRIGLAEFDVFDGLLERP